MFQHKKYFLIACLLFLSCGLQAAVTVVDDLGRNVTLKQPAQRIISLAPHITENLFSAGAGEQIVGAVEYSNFPHAAQQIPRVGSSERVNLEAIIQLQPDLIVAWASGNGMTKIQSIIDLGIPVYIVEPAGPEGIANNIERFGRLAGSEATASPVAADFRQTLARLKADYSEQVPVSVFYQIWNKPLYTVSGDHFISRVIELCGGRNVFGTVAVKAPQISVEAVLVADPQAIVASGMDKARPEWLDDWLVWPGLQAVRHQHLFYIPPDFLQRYSERLLSGATMLCENLAQVRAAAS